jgi:hypothetical protein
MLLASDHRRESNGTVPSVIHDVAGSLLLRVTHCFNNRFALYLLL